MRLDGLAADAAIGAQHRRTAIGAGADFAAALEKRRYRHFHGDGAGRFSDGSQFFHQPLPAI